MRIPNLSSFIEGTCSIKEENKKTKDSNFYYPQDSIDNFKDMHISFEGTSAIKVETRNFEMKNNENEDSPEDSVIISNCKLVDMKKSESLPPIFNGNASVHTENKNNEEADNKVYISCELCDYQSEVKKEIKTHMEEFHKNLCLFCDYCDFTTLVRSGMTIHMKSVCLLYTSPSPRDS